MKGLNMNIYKNKAYSFSDRADDLLSKMSLQEKIGQMNQRLYGWQIYEKENGTVNFTDVLSKELDSWGSIGAIYGVLRADPWSGKNSKNGLSKEESKSLMNSIQKYVIENTRLGIPVLFSEECSHGHQGLDSLVFPSNTGRGASWNTKLHEQVFSIISEEISDKGAHLGLISLFDMLREPRWGRSEECFGEDPHHAAVFSTSAIQGFQQSGKTICVAKHFCGQGEPEGGHNSGAVSIGPRELREIHTVAPELAIKKGLLKAVMAAYNEIDGLACHANEQLIQGFLRDQLEFKGLVMADGTGIDRLNKMTNSSIKSAQIALQAGIDISLWDKSYTLLEKVVRENMKYMKKIDAAVKRILLTKFELGLFDNPYKVAQVDEEDNLTDAYKMNIAKQSSRESIVLLKNDGILPLNSDKSLKIAVVGPNANNIYAQLGDYVSQQRSGVVTTVLDGITKEFDKHEILYKKGCDIFEYSEEKINETVSEIQGADIIILVVGGSSERNFDMEFLGNGAVTSKGKNMDCGENVDVGNLNLSNGQQHLIKKLSETDIPIVTVLIQGRPYVINDVLEKSNAVMTAWYPGTFGGQAVAEVLSGKYNPDGKLPVTIPENAYQLPIYYNKKYSNAKVDYVNNLGGGKFPFGYGLSYSKFEYKELLVKEDCLTIAQLLQGEQFCVRVRVKNCSLIDGSEVVQLYIHRKNASVVPRMRELKSFKKEKIPAGKTISIDLFLGIEELKILNQSLEYSIEESEIEILIGNGRDTFLKEVIKISE